jgi:hypothetical protein
MPSQSKIYINGINAQTGQYLVEPMTPKQLMPFITGEEDNSVINWLRNRQRMITTFQLGLDYDWTDVTAVGWGLVFRQGEIEEVKKALEPLYQHRLGQVKSKDLVRKMEYHPGESWKAFLGHYGIAPGSKDPEKIPFYMLLVGSPEYIPFEFGNKLDVEYAVGRLDFADPADYAAYAASVIAYETSPKVTNARKAVFFGTRHQFDPATILSADHLVSPLADGLNSGPGIAKELDFKIQKVIGEGATRSALSKIFAASKEEKPALVFTASHGMAWPKEMPNEQRAYQGALLCQDWPGFGKIAPAHYFTATDLPAGTRLDGLVAFHFACYSAGTPTDDRYLHKPKTKPPTIAPKSFIAALPKAMLSRGALAVIGHVERAWGFSISTPEAGAQIGPFRCTIGRILKGLPVGYAVKDINERFASLSVNLKDLLERKSFGETISDQELSSAWIECNDSEGYIIVGDPAVRLRVNDLK